MLEVEVYCLKIYGKYGESRQHSGSANKREGIALLLPPNHLWVLCLAIIRLLRFACNLLAERSGIEEKKKLHSDVGPRKDKEVMNLIP